jgi:hypothetical protein
MRKMLMAFLPSLLAGVFIAQTLPAPRNESAARAALESFFRAMLAGDDAAALPLLSYSKPENRETCESMLHEAAARQRLATAITDSFGKEAADALFAENEAAPLVKLLAQAKVTLKGDAAEVVIDPRMPPFILVQQNSKWLIQFEKTQENMGPLPREAEIAQARRRAAAYIQIVADMKSKKLKSFLEVREAVIGVAADAAMLRQQ